MNPSAALTVQQWVMKLLSHSLRFREKIVSKEFMRKYIHIAKGVTPVLTEEAANHIAEEYSRLRSQEQLGVDIARVSSRAEK